MASRKAFPWTKVLIGAVAVGIPVYILTRSSNANAAPLPTPRPSSGGGGGGSTQTGPVPTPPPGAPRPPAVDAMVARLSASKDARRTYWFQNLLYSATAALTGGDSPFVGTIIDPPDGQYGPHTKRYYELMMNLPAGSAPSSLPTSVFQNASRFVDGFLTISGTQLQPAPYTLPLGIVSLIDAEARQAYGNATLLQTYGV